MTSPSITWGHIHHDLGPAERKVKQVEFGAFVSLAYGRAQTNITLGTI